MIILIVLVLIIAAYIAAVATSEDFYIGILSFLIVIVLIPMLCFIIGGCISKPFQKMAVEEEYKALSYKIENCQDEFGLLNADIVDEVCEWNKEVQKHQKYEKNFWVGIFYPNGIYDNCQTIEYSKIK